MLGREDPQGYPHHQLRTAAEEYERAMQGLGPTQRVCATVGRGGNGRAGGV
jgi:hypothetical protein